MKKDKAKKKVRQVKRNQSSRRNQTRNKAHSKTEHDYSTYKVSSRAAAFWISGFFAAITLVGNYEHLLVTSSWVKYFVQNWILLLDRFWEFAWRLIGLDPPAWLKIISSHIVFLSVYLSGTGIPRKAKKHYDQDSDFLDIGLPTSTPRWRFFSGFISDFYIYTGLKYITIGLSVHPGIRAFSITSVSFSAMSAVIILFVLSSPYLKLYYRKKLAARMVYILFGALFMYVLSIVPFMQFDPAQLPPASTPTLDAVTD